MMNDEFYMKKAIQKARIAGKQLEIPVGAVLVHNDEIIATGMNRKEKMQSALLHAETVCIQKACKKLNRWRLEDCTLYVTMEPCPMCTGAIINARIGRVVYGCPDKKAGSLGSVVDLRDFHFNHNFEVQPGVLEKECSEMLSKFFQNLRISKKKNQGEQQ